MKTDENTTMPLARIARAYYQLATKTSRYLFSDSRQRIVTYLLIFLCFLTPSSTSFVLYQGKAGTTSLQIFFFIHVCKEKIDF
uniref:Uncharacterized protein n=1 Tax=Caenorhabditis japonica TaxID=281687 RepID=A0A8R1DWV6_CAEJA